MTNFHRIAATGFPWRALWLIGQVARGWRLSSTLLWAALNGWVHLPAIPERATARRHQPIGVRRLARLRAACARARQELRHAYEAGRPADLARI